MENYREFKWLTENYIDRKLSMAACGQLAGVNAMVIHYWLKKNGIRTRTVAAHMKGQSNPFRGRKVAASTRSKISASLTGKKRSQESIEKQRKSISGAKNVNFGKPRRHGKTLWLELPCGDVFAVRSRWEAFFADHLTGKGYSWLYEPATFTLRDGSAYTPDFLSEGVYYEIKGYMTEEDRRKIDGFRMEFPNLQLQVLGLPEMESLGFRNRSALTLSHLKVVSGRYSTCPLCSKVFLAPSAKSKFCSKKCNARKPKKAPVALECPVCGKTVKLAPSQAASRKTCSAKCGRIFGATKRSGEHHWSAIQGR